VVNHLNGVCTAAPASAAFPSISTRVEEWPPPAWESDWHVTPDIMAYYTYSEGFRPGGFNRTNSLPGQTPILSGWRGTAVLGPRIRGVFPAEASPVKIPASSTSPLALARTS